MLTTLADTGLVAVHLDDPSWFVADCRFDLRDPAAGARAYESGHIPGAVHVDLDRHLAGEKTGTNGRHPLPAPDTLARTLGALGIGAGTQVIAYDSDNGMYAARLWWMLRWLGHDAVAVLDGGFARWVGEARVTTPGVERRDPQPFTARLRPEMLVSVAEVEQRSTRGWMLLDARAPERYRGDVEPLDRVAGHIPGAGNRFFQSNLGPDGTFKSADELRAELRRTMGETPADQVVAYCGSGVTACHNLLAMAHAGLTGAKLYAGSWSEWSANPGRPVETSPVSE